MNTQIKQAVIQWYLQKCPPGQKGVEGKSFLDYSHTLCLLWLVNIRKKRKKNITFTSISFSAQSCHSVCHCALTYTRDKAVIVHNVILYFALIYPILWIKYSFCWMYSSWNIKTRMVLLEHITWKWSYDDTTLSVAPKAKKY